MNSVKKWIKPIAIVAVIAAVLILGGNYLNLQDRLVGALNWIKDLGPIGLAVFVLLYIIACIFFIPGSILTLGAGAIYGVTTGTILVSLSSTLGATAAFLVGRYFARRWVAKKIEGNDRFKSIDDAVAREGWKIVLLTRLSPVFSFNLLNYAYGLTKVPAREYIPASWIGMLPGTLMYVYLGSLAGDLASLGAESQSAPGPAQWAIRILAFLATVGVTFYVTKIGRKALSEKIDE